MKCVTFVANIFSTFLDEIIDGNFRPCSKWIITEIASNEYVDHYTGSTCYRDMMIKHFFAPKNKPKVNIRWNGTIKNPSRIYVESTCWLEQKGFNKVKH